jgi:gliding motility-associated-like protein
MSHSLRSVVCTSLLCLLTVNAVKAQLCNGSLGDPVVNINFGSAYSNAGTNAPGSNLTYTSSACPNDGYYTLTSATSNCFNNAWHTVTNDHTGSGNFMLVNASFQPSDFFVSTVSDLCPNTTYEFAAWLLNVFIRPGIKPNITFKIETPDGIVLKKYDTGDVPEVGSPEWKQYGFYFTTPATNAKIVLRMTNNAPGGIGNDIGLDDITFRPCGPKVEAGIQNQTADTIHMCEGNTNTYVLTAKPSSAYQAPVYQWQLSVDSGASWKDIAGATSATYVRPPVTKAGNYWYRAAITEASVAQLVSCRIASNVLAINMHANPVVNAGPDKIVLANNTATLNGSITGNDVRYNWSPTNYLSSNTTLAPVVTPPAATTYTLSAESIYGCAGKDDVDVKVVAGFFVPTAFTPDGDGKNDRWQIPFLDPDFGAEVFVFNRFGQTLYHTTGAVVSWDGKWNGKAQPMGTYIYLVRFTNNPLLLKGTFTLIR